MLDSSSATYTIGLEHEGAHVKGVELHYERKQIVCHQAFVLDGPSEEEDVKPLFMSEQGKALEKSASQSLVITGMETTHTVIRQIDVKLKKEKDIDAVLPFQAEPLLAFPVENAYLDKSILESNQDGSLLSIFAVPREHVEMHIENWKRLGIEPEIVGSVPHALAVFAGFALADSPLSLVIHVGHFSTTCALVKQDKLLAAQSFRGGIHFLAEAYLSDIHSDQEITSDAKLIEELNGLHVDENKHPLLFKTLIQFERECIRAAFGLAKYARVTDINAILVTGDGARHRSLTERIAKAIGKPLATLTLPPSFQLSEVDASYYAVPIGLALTALPNHKEQIDFRQKDLSYPYPWKRLRVSIASYILACMALAGATYLLGQSYLGRQEDNIRQEYVKLISYLKKDYNKIEEQVKNAKTDAEGDVIFPSPKELTASQIKSRLDLFEKEINASPTSIPLFPHLPRVSDILVWLSRHPQIAISSSDKDLDAQIHIDSLNYRMIKRPELNKLKEKYQVQLEIDFSSESARAARLFYDSLMIPNEIVDPKSEVKWALLLAVNIGFHFFYKI